MNIIPMNESQDASEDEERVFTKIRRRAKRIQEGNAARNGRSKIIKGLTLNILMIV